MSKWATSSSVRAAGCSGRTTATDMARRCSGLTVRSRNSLRCSKSARARTETGSSRSPSDAGNQVVEVTLDVGTRYGKFSPTFPHKCQKSDLILAELLRYLVDHQQDDGSFGDPVHDTFCATALLASGEAKYLPAVKRNVKYHCGVTKAKDLWLINWSYMSAAIVLSEYYLATGEAWVLPVLQKVHDLIAKSQYLRMSQIDPRAKKSHPGNYPRGPKDSHGGWGHNPGFEGYGPIAMLTGQGALAYSLMQRCGIVIDRKKHDAAYDFLNKGTGRTAMFGTPTKKAEVRTTGPTWAGPGPRASPISSAHTMAPPTVNERFCTPGRSARTRRASPTPTALTAMGMAYAALAASVDR